MTGRYRYSVLIVDDDPVCRLFCSHALTTSGYRVWFAGNGETAIAKALAELPGVVLTDMHLPDMSGAEAMSRVLALWPAGRTCPRFIALSGDDSAGEYALSCLVPFDSVLIKPVSKQALLACIGDKAGRPASSSGPATGYPGIGHEAALTAEWNTEGLHLRTIFCIELNRQLPELDAQITALDWERAAETLHRLTGAAALAGFTDFALQGRMLLIQINREKNLGRLAELYLDFLTQAARLTENQPVTETHGLMQGQ